MTTRRTEYAVLYQAIIGATLAVAVAMLAACSTPPERTGSTTTETATPAVATLRPPPVRAEVVPAAPSARVAWNPGRWSWNGSGFLWIAGHWVDRPYANATWEPGHWVGQGDGWVWDEGRWRA